MLKKKMVKNVKNKLNKFYRNVKKKLFFFLNFKKN